MFEGVFGKEGIFGKGGVFGQGCGFTPYTDTSDDAPVQDTEYTIEEGTGLYIVNTSGDLIVRGVEGDQLRMIVPDNRGPGVAPPMAHHDPASKQVQITSANQNIIVEAPWQVTNLHITHIDGNVRLIDLSADVQVTANDGNLSAQDITGAFRGTTNDSNVTIKDLHSSDVDMTINDGSALVGMDVLTEGSVKMVSANAPISLSLPDASAFDLTARVSGGRITTNLTDASDIGDKLELSHNGGGASIYLEAQSGNIDVRVIDTGATERIEEEDKKKKKKKKK
jgi:hypothetical protein